MRARNQHEDGKGDWACDTQALLLRADELTNDALHVRRLAAQLRPLVVVAEPNDLAARSQPATRR